MLGRAALDWLVLGRAALDRLVLGRAVLDRLVLDRDPDFDLDLSPPGAWLGRGRCDASRDVTLPRDCDASRDAALCGGSRCITGLNTGLIIRG